LFLFQQMPDDKWGIEVFFLIKSKNKEVSTIHNKKSIIRYSFFPNLKHEFFFEELIIPCRPSSHVRSKEQR